MVEPTDNRDGREIPVDEGVDVELMSRRWGMRVGVESSLHIQKKTNFINFHKTAIIHQNNYQHCSARVWIRVAMEASIRYGWLALSSVSIHSWIHPESLQFEWVCTMASSVCNDYRSCQRCFHCRWANRVSMQRVRNDCALMTWLQISVNVLGPIYFSNKNEVNYFIPQWFFEYT